MSDAPYLIPTLPAKKDPYVFLLKPDEVFEAAQKKLSKRLDIDETHIAATAATMVLKHFWNGSSPSDAFAKEFEAQVVGILTIMRTADDSGFVWVLESDVPAMVTIAVYLFVRFARCSYPNKTYYDNYNHFNSETMVTAFCGALTIAYEIFCRRRQIEDSYWKRLWARAWPGMGDKLNPPDLRTTVGKVSGAANVSIRDVEPFCDIFPRCSWNGGRGICCWPPKKDL